jgi:hypothetical protein
MNANWDAFRSLVCANAVIEAQGVLIRFFLIFVLGREKQPIQSHRAFWTGAWKFQDFGCRIWYLPFR